MGDAAIDFAAMDAVETIDVSTETEQSSDVKSTAESALENQQSQQEPQLDGRRGPQNIRQSIKAASEALPEQAQHFKELGNAYFREQAYKQSFPTPQEATQAKQLLETIGGVDGYAQVQQRMEAYDAQDAGLREGNPEVLDSFFKDFPEGAASLAPHYLERLSQANPDAYATAVGPHAISLLEKADVGGHLQAMVNEQDPARREALVKQLAEWFQGQKQSIGQKPVPQKNPQADKIAQERQAIETEKEQIFTSKIQDRVNTAAGQSISQVVEQYAKQYKFTPDQKQDFLDSLNRRIVEKLNGDKSYKQQIDIRKKSKDRDPQKIADYMTSEVKRILPDTALSLAKVRYGNRSVSSGTGVVRADAPLAPNGMPQKISQRPPDSALDLKYPGADMDLILGRGRMKGTNRLVTWR